MNGAIIKKLWSALMSDRPSDYVVLELNVDWCVKYNLNCGKLMPRSIILPCKWMLLVSARRLEVYEVEKSEAAARSVTLRSGCSRKSLSCRSLSCNHSSVSLNTFCAESEDDDHLPNHMQARTNTFCSRVVRLSHTHTPIIESLFVY